MDQSLPRRLPILAVRPARPEDLRPALAALARSFVEDLGRPVAAGATVDDWLDSLPRSLAANDAAPGARPPVPGPPGGRTVARPWAATSSRPAALRT